MIMGSEIRVQMVLSMFKLFHDGYKSIFNTILRFYSWCLKYTLSMQLRELKLGNETPCGFLTFDEGNFIYTKNNFNVERNIR